MGEKAAPLGLILSQWFTSEWFASPGSGYPSSEENLPPLPENSAESSEWGNTLAAIRGKFDPLCDFEDRFERALMPPQVSGHLTPYAHLLTEYARAMVEFCEDAEGQRKVPETSAETLLEKVDRPETECYRLPASLVEYAKRLTLALERV